MKFTYFIQGFPWLAFCQFLTANGVLNPQKKGVGVLSDAFVVNPKLLFYLSMALYFKFICGLKGKNFINIWAFVKFVLGFYGPDNPLGSCQALSVYLTTLLGENDRRKDFIIIFHKRMLPTPGVGSNLQILITSRAGIQPSHRGRHIWALINP